MTFLLLSLAVVLLLSVLVVIHMARTSPEGYEDETGFHFVGAKRAAVSAQANRMAGVDLVVLTQPPFAIRG